VLKLRRAATMLIAAVAVFSQSQVAVANNFGSDWDHTRDNTDLSQCVGWWKSGYQEFAFYDVGANQASAVRYACTNIYDPVTDLECVEPPTLPIFGVDVYDGSYGTKWYAWTQCATGAAKQGSAADHTKACIPQQLKFDLSHTAAYDTATERRKIACHEFGHTYGLRHSTGDGTSTCMTAKAIDSTVVGISSHDKSHLNGYYN